MTDRTARLLRLLDAQGKALHALLARITLRTDVADDLLQELFLRLSRRAWLPGDERLPGYARRTAMRLAFDWRRRQRRARLGDFGELDAAGGEPPPEQRLERSEEIERVLAELERLPRLAREAVALRYLEQRSFDEIGQTLGRTAKQARALCAKGLGRLRRSLRRSE